MLASVTSDPRIGTVIDNRYRIIEQIALGGMGAVYRAERVKLGRMVAVKFLHAWSATHKQARKRFDLEARAMAQLDHPNCASVIDFGIVDAVPYVVMEYVRGETLREILDRGPLPVERATDIMRQVLSGLAHAHEKGIVHRDIKPANIMVGDATGVGVQVKILDFGLARLLQDDTRMTAQGKILGTPAYMAPEQTRASQVDGRSDIYACGVLLFELLTGRKPFEGDDPVSVLQMQRTASPPAMSSVVAQYFGDYEHVVACALRKQPEQRFQTAVAFTEAIDRARHSTRVQYQQAKSEFTMPVPRTGDHRRALIIGSVLALLVVGALVAVFAGGNDSEAPTPIDAALPVDAESPPDAGNELEGDRLDLPRFSEARQLIASERLEQAIEVLTDLQTDHSDVAQISYHLGQLYFRKLWWKNGMAAFRKAIAIEPRYRAYEPLIASVLRGFASSIKERSDLNDFLLTDIGDAAVPLLKQTARDHSQKKIRARATKLLRRFRDARN